MESDLQHTSDGRVTEFSLVDMPLDVGSDSESVRKICTLLEEDGRIICIADHAGGDYSALARLRDCLPGFVAMLDHREYSDLSVPLAKSLSLGSDQTDEKILHNRWQAFSAVTQRSNLPFTLILTDADSLTKSRLTQIREFLRPIKGRLILAGCDDVSRLFDATETHLDAAPPDVDVPTASNRSKESEAEYRFQSTEPIADTDTLAKSPIMAMTDDAPPPKSVSVPGPATVPAHTRRHSKRNQKPFGWLIAGLGLGGVLGFLVAVMPVPYESLGFDRWFKGLVDGAFQGNVSQSMQRSEPAHATTSADHSGIAQSDVPQQEKNDTTVMLPTDAVDDPQEGLSISAQNTEITGEPTAPVAENPVTDVAALEKTPTTDSVPEGDAKSVAKPTANEPSAASQSIEPPAADTEKIQTPEPEPKAMPDPAERARIAETYLRHAEREREIGNLQQALLEVARGLDVDPDNKRLQDLRREVLVDMDARTQ